MAPVLSLLQRSTGGVGSRGTLDREGDYGFAWGSLGVRGNGMRRNGG